MTIEEKKLAYFFSNIVSDNKTMNDGLKQIGYLQQMNNMTWDPQSPRFAKAMFSLGIVKEDIILKNKDFFGPPSDKKLQTIRYNQHRRQVMENLNEIIKERNKK